MNRLFAAISRLFDRMDAAWESQRARHIVADTLIVSFVGALVMIEAQRRSLLPPALATILPTNHFYAVDFTLQLVQIIGLVGIIFGLARSVANTVGKQLEILSLILLRGAFRELTAFDEPMTWAKARPAILPIMALATGALVMFVILRFYYRAQRHQAIADDFQNLAGFVATKKVVALGLLLAFISIGIYTLQQYLVAGRTISFFGDCYTVLIFSDVLLVFVSMHYSSTYHVVFRNTGFAIATVLIRVAVIAPAPFNALVGIGSTLFALGLTVAYNTFASAPPVAAVAPVPAALAAMPHPAAPAPTLNGVREHDREHSEVVGSRR
ncbi:MAG: hypothetical protein HGA45_19140 [Chloroflexales bacterium]|nr:hypothetical protein [Chloroflexales bacterium]